MAELHFDGEGFGWIIIDGRRYEDDVVVTVDGRIDLRPKQLSKKYGGWHTVLGPEEMAGLLEGNPETLVIACGHFGLLPIRSETRALLAGRGVKLETMRISRALKRYQELARQGKRAAALLHVTC